MRRRVGAAVAVVVALLGVLAAVLALGGPGVVEPDGATREPDAAAGAGVPSEGAHRAESGVASDDARPQSSAGAPAPGSTLPDPVGREIVRTVQLTLQVADPAAAGRGVRTAVAAAGGLVAEEQADTTGAWLVLRVPVDRLDRLVDELATTGAVLARTGRTEDATEQVVDLDGRVATQQTSVARVRALLARATSIGDVVAVESELARREADLESLQRRLAALRDRVALATLTVELRAAPAPPDSPQPGFGAGLGAGWAGLRAAGAVLATAAGFVLPFLPVVALVAGAVWVVVRRRRRRGAAEAG
jgi:hypothetical protein